MTTPQPPSFKNSTAKASASSELTSPKPEVLPSFKKPMIEHDPVVVDSSRSQTSKSKGANVPPIGLPPSLGRQAQEAAPLVDESQRLAMIRVWHAFARPLREIRVSVASIPRLALALNSKISFSLSPLNALIVRRQAVSIAAVVILVCAVLAIHSSWPYLVSTLRPVTSAPLAPLSPVQSAVVVQDAAPSLQDVATTPQKPKPSTSENLPGVSQVTSPSATPTPKNVAPPLANKAAKPPVTVPSQTASKDVPEANSRRDTVQQPVSLKTVDGTFNERVAAECESGLLWLVCREKIRYQVCSGKWSDQPETGASICKGAGK